MSAVVWLIGVLVVGILVRIGAWNTVKNLAFKAYLKYKGV